MNVQKDDLAVIIMPPLNGKLVKVIDRAPTGRDFTLPDGYVHKKTDGDWIIESLGALFSTPTTVGRRDAMYAVVDDRHLRPLRGEPVRGEIVGMATDLVVA
jgi:hypothetical protein